MSSIILRNSRQLILKESSSKKLLFSKSRCFFSTSIKPLQQHTHSHSHSSSQQSSHEFKSAKSKAKGEAIFGRFVRSSKFLVSSSIVLAALGVSSVAVYLVFDELFSPSGETSTFNRVVSQIENDDAALKLLGYSQEDIESNKSIGIGKKIRLKAYGQAPSDKWSRNRPITATKFTAKDGKEHMLMRFFVESETKVAVVQLEAIEENFIKQKLIYVSMDVKGEPRYYLVGSPKTNTIQKRMNILNNPDGGFLGVHWGPKKA